MSPAGAVASRSRARRPAAPGRPAYRAPARVSSMVLILGGAGLAAIAWSVANAPDPAPMRVCWRTESVLLASVLGAWNLVAARRAFLRAAHLSAVGMLQVWSFFSFSFAAAEQCYRYDYLQIGFWRGSLDTPATFGTVVLLGTFQLTFFLALGRDVPLSRLSAALRGAPALPARRPADGPPGAPERATPRGRRAALLLVAAALPFLAARVMVFHRLGLRTIATTIVTRTDYFGYLGGNKVDPELWVLNALFPVVVVSTLCLAVRYAVPAVSRRGARTYSAVLVLCSVGGILSGGRGDLVFTLLTVLVAMRLHGYRTLGEFRPVLTPVALAAVLLFLIAQARNGDQNTLTNLAGDPYVGGAYHHGEITQLLGVGRFDAVRMIVDKHSTAHDLGAQDYLEAIKGSLDSVFLPRLLTGKAWPFWHVSANIIGPWIFGEVKGSSLPSAPGELYLTFGLPGVVVGGLLFGLVTRGLLRLAAAAPGPAQITWVLLVWTVARALSDESYLIGTFIAQNWPCVPLLGLLVRRYPISGPTAAPAGDPRPAAGAVLSRRGPPGGGVRPASAGRRPALGPGAFAAEHRPVPAGPRVPSVPRGSARTS